jgi:hypothetical protein
VWRVPVGSSTPDVERWRSACGMTSNRWTAMIGSYQCTSRNFQVGIYDDVWAYVYRSSAVRGPRASTCPDAAV